MKLIKKIKEIIFKVKDYDEALEKIKHYVTDECGCTRLKPSDIFQELKESEDEKIRKALLEHIKGITSWGYFLGISREQMIAWLKKQGEQNPMIIPKFKVGDTIRHIDFGYTKVYTIKDILDDCYLLADDIILRFEYEYKWELVEQNPAEYSLEQAAGIFLDALSLTPYNNKPIIDAQIITKELLKFLSDSNSYNPNALEEQKPVEWSEEDKQILDEIIKDVMTLHNSKTIEGLKCKVNWLKSLRPQPHWKPSEEGIKAFEWAYKSSKIEEGSQYDIDCKDLLEQLKAL